MDAHVPMLVITGSVGVGKTAVAFEVSEFLEASGVPHAVVDLDALTWSYPRPPDDRFHLRLAVRNLGDLWRNYREAGARRLVVATVVESSAELDALRGAVPGAEVNLVRLRASLPVLLERVRRREIGSALEWHLLRAKELATQMDATAIQAYVVDTDGMSVAAVAEQVLAAAGWEREVAGPKDDSSRTAAAGASASSSVRPSPISPSKRRDSCCASIGLRTRRTSRSPAATT